MRLSRINQPQGIVLLLSSTRFRIVIALIAVYFIWGSTYVAIRVVVQEIPPFLMSSVRLFGASSVIFAWLMAHHKSTWPPANEIRNAMFVGGLMFGGGAGMVAFAEQWVSSGLAALAVAAVPIWAAIFAGFWGRWPGGLEWLGLIVGISGVVLLNLENEMQANPLGATVLLFGPMMWAFGSMWSRRSPLPEGFTGVAFQLLGGGIVMVLLSVITREQLTAMPSVVAILTLMYLTLAGTLVAFSAYMYLIYHVRPTLATSYAYVNPIVAVVLGIIILGETISPSGMTAMVVILLGVGLIAAGKERQSR